MARRALALVAACVLSGVTLGAQTASQCASQSVTVRDACQKGTDLFLMLAPQLNGAMAAGGPLVGTARTADGLSLTLRVSAVDGRVPEFTGVSYSTTGVAKSTIGTTRAPVPAPSLDIALSAFPGFRSGRQRILAADLLVSVMYVPSRDLESFSVKTTNGAFKAGFGTRVALLSETPRLPAVSVSYQRRTTPYTTLATSLPLVNLSSSAVRDSLSLAETSLRADAFRASISKRFGFLELGGGVGQDRYRNFTQLRTRVTPVALGTPLTPVSSAFVVTQRLNRNSAYGTLALNFGRVHVGVEAGATFGGDSVQTYNTFTDANTNGTRTYGTLGLRYSF